MLAWELFQCFSSSRKRNVIFFTYKSVSKKKLSKLYLCKKLLQWQKKINDPWFYNRSGKKITPGEKIVWAMVEERIDTTNKMVYHCSECNAASLFIQCFNVTLQYIFAIVTSYDEAMCFVHIFNTFTPLGGSIKWIKKLISNMDSHVQFVACTLFSSLEFPERRILWSHFYLKNFREKVHNWTYFFGQ